MTAQPIVGDLVPPLRSRQIPKAVLVHGGARDSYQMAVAMSEAGLLESLVTDLFWPSDKAWAEPLRARLPSSLRELVLRRSVDGLPSSQVFLLPIPGLRSLLFERLPHLPFDLRRLGIRASDAALGVAAGRLARKTGTGLVAYSYFAWHAMREYQQSTMLFQVHPHPATIRRLLKQELADHPECSASLQQEWELALPECDFERLVAEPCLASNILVASTFTKASLVENGTPAASVTVVPYGVDLDRFHPVPSRSPGGVLRLLFVGRINQRKGISYLLEALRSFRASEVHLTVCGRVVDDLKIFEPFGSQVTIRPSVSGAELIAAYQSADLFVFPSVAEGFGQVLLESLACGLPILTTTSTAAPDLILDGGEGFIVEPRRPDQLVARIRWAINHRQQLEEMRLNARACASQFTWSRFRERAAKAVASYLDMRSSVDGQTT